MGADVAVAVVIATVATVLEDCAVCRETTKSWCPQPSGAGPGGSERMLVTNSGTAGHQLVAPSAGTHHMVRRRAGISWASRTITPPSASAIPAQNWAQRTEEPVRARVPVPPVPETVSARAAIVVVVPPPP